MKTTKELARELGLLRKRSLSTSTGAQKDSKPTGQQFAYLIIIDFESTCWKDDKFKAQEIIEFPAVLLNTSSGEIESEFHHYVQPQEQPTLSAFCTELTGITQEKVDEGIPINLCLKKFCHWLEKLSREKNVICHGHTTPDGRAPTCTMVTWSDWDLGVCLQYECKRKQLLKPVQLTSWIDLRATYRRFYDRKPNGLNGALQDLGISFEGREHSGLDDSRNTAKLAFRMIQDGCVMKITKTLKNHETIPRPSIKGNFLQPLRISPPRKAKNSTPKNSPKDGKNSSGPVRKTSKIPRPVNNSDSDNEPDCAQTPRKASSLAPACKGKILDSPDGRSPLAKRRKINSLNSPKQTGNFRVKTPTRNSTLYTNKASNSSKSRILEDPDSRSPLVKRRKMNSVNSPKQTGNFRVKTPAKNSTLYTNKVSPNSSKNRTQNSNKPKTISQSGFQPSNIYVDPVDSSSSRSADIMTDNASQKLGLKVQDGNIQTSNKRSPDKMSRKPLSPSANGKKLNNILKPVSSNKPNNLCNLKTSTPVSGAKNPKEFFKHLAPSPINSTSRTSSASSKGMVTKPKPQIGQPSAFVTPASSGPRAAHPKNPAFKTPSPVNYSGNPSTVFKTPSPTSGTMGSAMKSTPPLCKCGRRSKRRIVQAPGQNTGRFFFSCAVRHSAASKNGCDFFKWETSFSPSSNNSSTASNGSLSGRKATNPSKQFCPTPIGRMSFKTPVNSFRKTLGVKPITVSTACSLRV